METLIKHGTWVSFSWRNPRAVMCIRLSTESLWLTKIQSWMDHIFKEPFPFILVLQLNFQYKKIIIIISEKTQTWEIWQKVSIWARRQRAQTGRIRQRLWLGGDQVAGDQHWKAESGAKYNQQLSWKKQNQIKTSSVRSDVGCNYTAQEVGQGDGRWQNSINEQMEWMEDIRMGGSVFSPSLPNDG